MRTFIAAFTLAGSNPVSASQTTLPEHQPVPTDIEFRMSFPNQLPRVDPCAGEVGVESRVVVTKIYGRGVLTGPGGRISGFGVLEITHLQYRLTWKPPTFPALCTKPNTSSTGQVLRAFRALTRHRSWQLFPPLQGINPSLWYAIDQEPRPISRVVPPLLLTLNW